MARPIVNVKVFAFCAELLLGIIVITLTIVYCKRHHPHNASSRTILPDCKEENFTKGAVAADNVNCSNIRLRTSLPDCKEENFTEGAVAADNVNCSNIGLNILKNNGTAVEAAIAALLCTGIMNPQSAGIGGGSIFTIMNSAGEVTIINSRETAPINVSRDLLNSCPEKPSQAVGGKWIGVPGELRGYEMAHNLNKRLNWSELFNETIKLAREGFPIPPVLGSYIQELNTTDTPESLKKLYSDENGTLLETGDMIKFEKLADTLELIANKGANDFYTGTVAEDLLRDVQHEGGNITKKDLASYKATETNAWVVPLGEYQMYMPPPPSGGPILSFVLNFMMMKMKDYENKPAPQTPEEKTTFYDNYIQALKEANKLKKCIRDPNFAPESFLEKAKLMTDINYADKIQDHCPSITNHTFCPEGVGTTHVSAVDRNGTFVSVTSSINDIFGSKVYSPNTGILLNNQLWDFCKRNISSITPGERPPSSMAPIVLKSKLKTLAIGASGGSMITTGLASALINHLWFGKSLKEAIDTRVVNVDCDDKVNLEPSFDDIVIKNLEGRGHKLANKFYNVVNAVEKKDGYICAVSDDRKLGEAAGYN